MQIWDVGSDEQAELLGSQFYDSAAGAVIVCRLGTAACLDGLTHWHQKLCQVASKTTRDIFRLCLSSIYLIQHIPHCAKQLI